MFGRLSSIHEHLNDPGARMGFIYDYFIQLLAEFHQIQVGIHWRMFPNGIHDREDDLPSSRPRDHLRQEWILESVSNGEDAQEDEEDEEVILSDEVQHSHLDSPRKNEIDLYFFLLCECMCPAQHSKHYNGWEELVVKSQEKDVVDYPADDDGYIRPIRNVTAPGQADPED